MLLAQEAFLEASDVRGRSRRVLRLAVNTSLAGDTPSTATIRNLSETGLLLETSVDLPVGEWIGVDLPGSGVRSAQVVWVSEHLYGCRFDEAVTPATVSAALLRAPFGAGDSPFSADAADSTLEEPPLSADRAAPRRDKMFLGAQIRIIVGITIALWTVIGGLLLLMVA